MKSTYVVQTTENCAGKITESVFYLKSEVGPEK